MSGVRSSCARSATFALRTSSSCCSVEASALRACATERTSSSPVSRTRVSSSPAPMASAPARISRSGRDRVKARYRAIAKPMAADTRPAMRCMRLSRCPRMTSSSVSSLPFNWLTVTAPSVWPRARRARRRSRPSRPGPRAGSSKTTRAALVHQAHGEVVDHGQVPQRLLGGRRPAAVVRVHDGGHLAEVRRRAMQPRLGGRRDVRVEVEVGVDGRQVGGEQRHADEGDDEPRAQAPAEAAPHRFASLYPTPITVSTYRGCDGSGSIFLRRFLTWTSMVRS